MKKYHKYIVFFNGLLVVGISFFISLKNVLADELVDKFNKKSKEMTIDFIAGNYSDIDEGSEHDICKGKQTGDVNCDGEINFDDVGLLNDYHRFYNDNDYSVKSYDKVMTYRYRVGWKGDVNGDGKINETDANELNFLIQSGNTDTGFFDATGCSGFKEKNACNSGLNANNDRFECTWNEKNKLCSPTDYDDIDKDSEHDICAGKQTGDVNCDGKINGDDISILSAYLEVYNDDYVSISTEIYSKARTYSYRVGWKGDINGDGKIDEDDLTELRNVLTYGHSYTGVLEAANCAGFRVPDACNSGLTRNNGRFNCTWNEKYEFCSPTGLTYLSCGSDKSDAHDIPVFLPRITSYAIIILKTATPIILIIMSMIQIIKAIASQNEDEMKKAKSALVKKLIAAALIFFVTTIVQFVIKQVADSSEAGSANQCLSCFVNNDCNGSMYYTDGYGKCYNVETKEEFECNTDIGDNYKNGFLNNNS